MSVRYDGAVLTILVHRRRTFRGLSALALLAWLGLVMMGVAHAAPVSMSMSMSMAAADQASSAPVMSHHARHGHAAIPDGAPDSGCGMTFGCHCGTSCYGAIMPCAPVLASASPVGETYAQGVHPVPIGVGDPPLHPPSL